MNPFIYEGTLTDGDSNDMENGYPVFIDNQPIDDLFKDWLDKQNIQNNFSYCPDRQGMCPLIGRHVRMTIEILDDIPPR